MAANKVVHDDLIERLVYYKAYSNVLYRLDVWPFLFLYGVFFVLLQMYIEPYHVMYSNAISSSDRPSNTIIYIGLIGWPVTLVVQLTLFLLSQWSIGMRCFLGYQVTHNIDQADFVHVNAAKHAGNDRLVAIERIPHMTDKPIVLDIMDQHFSITKNRIDFQKVAYNFDCDKNMFVRLEYPTNASMQSFLSWQGHLSINHVHACLLRWGINEFDIPMPNFLDLYLDHLVAPFFVFQVLCLFLWSLDDYWYYSAFTLCMLMFFEGMMCRQRQASLTMLRNMRRPAMNIYARRAGAWNRVSSDEIVPGDLISLTTDAFIPKKTRHSNNNNTSKEDHHHSNNDGHVIPCDAILVRGSCVVNEAMLTGESIPQMKESLRTRSYGVDDKSSQEDNEDATATVDGGGGGAASIRLNGSIETTWKRHMIFSGTSLLMHTERVDIEDSGSGSDSIPSAPDKGCLAVVVRTGFGTSQGGLMRKILFATERVTGNSSETFYFIGALVVFAVIAASVVLYGGLADAKRNKFRLVLHCIMIVTSVVPPELPMELSLAVTNSLAALAHSLVYCTEPYRISYAGRLDTICFDKTGTLTKDEMIFKGVVAPQDIAVFSRDTTTNNNNNTATAGNEELSSMMLEELSYAHEDIMVVDEGSPDIVLAMMGCCHDLMVPSQSDANGAMSNLVGDPLEIAAIQSSGFEFSSIRSSPSSSSSSSSSAITLVHLKKNIEGQVRQKYPFSSELKRMSVIVDLKRRTDGSVVRMVFCKGAPEVLAKHLVSIPPFYYSTCYYHMNRGRRVLALACKVLSAPSSSVDSSSRPMPRQEMEKSLIFVGFLIFDSDLKADSKSVVRELKAANHQVIMITGDSVYTAIDVGRRLGMIKSSTDKKGESSSSTTIILHDLLNSEVVWRPLGKEVKTTSEMEPDDIVYDVTKISTLKSTYSLCITGSALDILQKTLQTNAKFTTYLKSVVPHVTIFARVSPAQKEAIVLALNEAGLYTLMCGDGTNDVGALKAAHVGVSIVNNPEFERRIEATKDPTSNAKKGAKKPKGSSAKDRMARAMQELHEQEMDPTIVKLGDASIASPFTARRTSIDSVLTVIRQGRCTLVTTIQVYKVLALNCLISAYMMSALYLRGLKQGDTQMTASGVVIAALFFFLSQAKPVPGISAEKPTNSIFATSVIVSLLGQFVVHFTCLLAVLYTCEKYVSSDDFSLTPDGKFQPNVINSSIFLLSALMQVNNFVINYRGHPFTQSITENTMLWRSVQVLYSLLLIVAGGQFEPINDLLQMAPFPSPQFQAYLLGILIFNFAACYGVEKWSQKLEV